MTGHAQFIIGGGIGDMLGGVGMALAHPRFRFQHSDVFFFDRCLDITEFIRAQGLFRRCGIIPKGGSTYSHWMGDWPWADWLMDHLVRVTGFPKEDIIPSSQSWNPAAPPVVGWSGAQVPAHIIARLIARFPWAVQPFLLLHPWSQGGSCPIGHHYPHATKAMEIACASSPIPTVFTGLRGALLLATHNLAGQLTWMELVGLVALSHGVITTSNSTAFLGPILGRKTLILGNRSWNGHALNGFFEPGQVFNVMWDDPIDTFLRMFTAFSQ